MRLLPWLVLAISLALATPASARLFWQTYGSTVATAEGGCSWNVNQDYFVPRHSTSCRYGLYSPCKTSCTTSPACRNCHAIYPGYCSIYGRCHYRRRNHVYAVRCGCTPSQTCANDCCSTPADSCYVSGTCGSGVCCEVEAPLYNVEPSGLDTLGSIPVEGGELLSKTDFSQLGGAGGGASLLQSQGLLQQLQQLSNSGQLMQGLPTQEPPALNLPQFTQPVAK